MDDVRIRVSTGLNLSAIEDLATQLSESGRSVSIDEIKTIYRATDGHPVVNSLWDLPGTVVIILATGMVNAAASDIYKAGKTWARKVYHKHRDSEPNTPKSVSTIRVIVCDSENKVIGAFKINDSGESQAGKITTDD